MLERGEHHAIVNAGILSVVGQEAETVAIKLLDAEVRVVFRVGNGGDGVVLDVQISLGGIGGFSGFEVHVCPFFAEVLNIAVHWVDLCRDAQAACHADEEDVARMAVGLAGFQYA